MKFRFLLVMVVSLIALCSCEDEATILGVDMMPTGDLITKNFETYDVKTQSYAVGDSVLARTSMSYLGQFTDPETGTTIKSDFLAQFHCNEDFKLPDVILGDTCTSVELRLFVDNFVGDSLTTFKLSVFELDKNLNPNAEYYTNINPENYYNKNSEPIATKWYTISDRTITDSERWSSNYYRNIRITLPREVGNQIIKGYREDPSRFKNTASWTNSGLPGSKGFYFKLENGDGAMAYIDVAQFNLYFKYYDEGYEKDTTGISQFAATEEVVEATRFENYNLDKLLADNSATYLKCPAGVFTMATIPADQINVNDTVNSAKISFTRYNDITNSEFRLGVPKTLLMVRLDDYLNGYFEKYSIPDDITSYLATFNSSTNSYTYTNISRLVKTMVNEKNKGTATENWNKVLLIPVEITKNSSNAVVKLNHDFSMNSSRLVGGTGGNVKLEVIYSHFSNQ